MSSLLEKVRHPRRRAESETCAVCHEGSSEWIERWHAQEKYRLCCPECVHKFDAQPALYAR